MGRHNARTDIFTTVISAFACYLPSDSTCNSLSTRVSLSLSLIITYNCLFITLLYIPWTLDGWTLCVLRVRFCHTEFSDISFRSGHGFVRFMFHRLYVGKSTRLLKIFGLVPCYRINRDEVFKYSCCLNLLRRTLLYYFYFGGGTRLLSNIRHKMKICSIRVKDCPWSGRLRCSWNLTG